MFLILVFSLLAGIATVLSPCILPVLPAILSVSYRRPLVVILGLLTSFVFFTLALTTLVHLFGFSANVLRLIAILIIALFGIVMMVPRLSDWFAAKTGFLADAGSRLQTSSSFLVGAALGLVWTPCAGPILAAITALVATQKIGWMAILMTFAYAIGASIPLLLIAYGSKRLLNVPAIAKHAETIRKVFGALMLLTAFALYMGWETKLATYLPAFDLEYNHPFTRSGGSDQIVGITGWINTEPVTLKDLKGKVVLVDFWTYSCINCLRTLPYLERWYKDYKDLGFVILGVHTPEFEFEKDYNNVKRATEELGIKYPVLLDNNYATWESFDNLYWPADYLFNQEGELVEAHFGEGAYLETENKIRELLGLKPLEKEEGEVHERVMPGQTPETYLGYQRAAAYFQNISEDKSGDYAFSEKVEADQVGLKGLWSVGKEFIISESDGSELYLNFKADKVYLVAGGNSNKPIRIFVDNQLSGEIKIVEPKKYDLVDLKGKDGRHLLKLIVPKGIKLYAFTFGSR